MANTANKGGPSQPRALKLLGGRSEGKDSGGRDVPAAPKFVRGLPVKPGHLSDDASWLWDQVVDQMKTSGVLKPLDAPSLEVVCETFARWRAAVRMRAGGDQEMIQSTVRGSAAAAWVGIEERAAREFRAWCAEYGLTPAAEQNLATGDGSDGNENPFAG